MDFKNFQNPITGLAQSFVTQGDLVFVNSDRGLLQCEALTDIKVGQVVVFQDTSGKYWAVGERSQAIRQETTQFFKSRGNPKPQPKPRYALLIVRYDNTELSVTGTLGDVNQTVTGLNGNVCERKPDWILGAGVPQSVAPVCNGSIIANPLGNVSYYLYNSVTEKTTKLNLKLPLKEADVYILDPGINNRYHHVFLTTTEDQIRLTILHGRIFSLLPSDWLYEETISSYYFMKRYIFKWNSDQYEEFNAEYPNTISEQDDPNQNCDWQKPFIDFMYTNPISAYDGTFTGQSFNELIQQFSTANIFAFMEKMNRTYKEAILDNIQYRASIAYFGTNVLNYIKGKNIVEQPDPIVIQNEVFSPSLVLGISTLRNVYKAIIADGVPFPAEFYVKKYIIDRDQPQFTEQLRLNRIPLTLKPITDLDFDPPSEYNPQTVPGFDDFFSADYLEDPTAAPDFTPVIGIRLFFSAYINLDKL